MPAGFKLKGEGAKGKEEREIDMKQVAMTKSTPTCIYDINISLIQMINEKEVHTYICHIMYFLCIYISFIIRTLLLLVNNISSYSYAVYKLIGDISLYIYLCMETCM